MKPIIIEVSRDAKGREWVTMPREEFHDAIDRAYDAGMADGAALKEKEFKDLGVELIDLRAKSEFIKISEED